MNRSLLFITALFTAVTGYGQAPAPAPVQHLDGFLTIPWGVNEDLVKKGLPSKAHARFDAIKSKPSRLIFNGGKFANFKVRDFAAEFVNDRFWKAEIVFEPQSKDHSKEFATFKQLLTEKYGAAQNDGPDGDSLGADWYVGDGSVERDHIHLTSDINGGGVKLVYAADRIRKAAPNEPMTADKSKTPEKAKPITLSPTAKDDL